MPVQTPAQSVSPYYRDPNASILSAQAHHSFGATEMMGSRTTFGPNEEIFGESEPSDYVYDVVSGAVRTYKILADGRRQIGAFYLPGISSDLKLEQSTGFRPDAIGRTMVRVVRRSAVLTLASQDSKAARELGTFAAHELHHTQERMRWAPPV